MSSHDVVLIHPPVVKPAEPPAGVAQLKSALHAHHLSCAVIDANVEGQLYLLRAVQRAERPRVRMALRNRDKNLTAIRSLRAYQSFDDYKRCVLELRTLLAEAGRPEAAIGFTDFKQEEMLPVRSRDLRRAAAEPERNPFYAYFQAELLPRIDALSPRVIGLSLIYLSQALTAFALIGLLRRALPNATLMLGGGLVTSWMSQPGWSNPFASLIDEMIPGRGEVKLVESFGLSPDKAIHFAPDYDDVDWQSYFSPLRILPYSTSYGCYWRKCTFCPECAEGNRFDPAPHVQVFADLRALNAHRPGLIHFLDNALSPALLRKIATHGLPAPWYGYARFTEIFLQRDFCRALRESGCVMLQLGLESGSEEVLAKMRKGIALDRASLILRNLKRAGIAVYLYLLFGTPWETLPQARQTLQFVLDHADNIDYLNPALFNMPRFSQASQEHTTRSFYEGDLSLYHDFDHPLGWRRIDVRRFLQQEFLLQPEIRKIILSSPPSFTSSHAPFFAPHFEKICCHSL
ncbi:radical SAM protein [candidate division KSB1 bacterium]|nr:radical SAM protein [candidate division KSB1 bacterium]